MYELTVKEIRGSKIWSHDLGENFPQIPDSFSVSRLNLTVCAMFLPPTPLKNFLINVVETSSAWEFYFEVKKFLKRHLIKRSLFLKVWTLYQRKIDYSFCTW